MEIWPWWHTYSQSAMDEPPQALSPLPTASPVVRFSSPFSYCKTLFLLSWVFLLLFFREDVEFFLFYGFIVCLFPKKISGFMGLLEIWLVTVFVSQNFSVNPFLWLFCRFFTSIWLGIWVFFYGKGRDMRGEIIRTWSFFFFFFSMELLGLFLLVLVVFGWMFLLVICVWL